MGVLAFDTSTEFLSVCFFSSSGGATLQTRGGPLRHGANLVPLIDKVLKEAKVAGFVDVDLVACPRGPGSFTGLRIGYATAKGLSAAKGGQLPVVAVPTLELHGWRRREFPGSVVPILDARKGRFYTALFQKGERLTEDLDCSLQEVLTLAAQGASRQVPVLLTGFHADLLIQRLESGLPEGWELDSRAAEPTACDLARLALDHYRDGETLSEGEGPRYVRRSDAELARENSRNSM